MSDRINIAKPKSFVPFEYYVNPYENETEGLSKKQYLLRSFMKVNPGKT